MVKCDECDSSKLREGFATEFFKSCGAETVNHNNRSGSSFLTWMRWESFSFSIFRSRNVLSLITFTVSVQVFPLQKAHTKQYHDWDMALRTRRSREVLAGHEQNAHDL